MDKKYVTEKQLEQWTNTIDQAHKFLKVIRSGDVCEQLGINRNAIDSARQALDEVLYQLEEVAQIVNKIDVCTTCAERTDVEVVYTDKFAGIMDMVEHSPYPCEMCGTTTAGERFAVYTNRE